MDCRAEDYGVWSMYGVRRMYSVVLRTIARYINKERKGLRSESRTHVLFTEHLVWCGSAMAS